jgi:hypothetical protein
MLHVEPVRYFCALQTYSEIIFTNKHHHVLGTGCNTRRLHAMDIDQRVGRYWNRKKSQAGKSRVVN